MDNVPNQFCKVVQCHIYQENTRNDTQIDNFAGFSLLKLPPKTEFTDEEQILGSYIRHCFSKFAGSAHISNTTQQSIIWFMEVNVKTSYLCEKYSLLNDTHDLRVSDSGSGVHCMWQIEETPEETQLHEVEFYGFDTIVTLLYETLEKLCQYGGLYVLYRHDWYDWNVYEERHVRDNAMKEY